MIEIVGGLYTHSVYRQLGRLLFQDACALSGIDTWFDGYITASNRYDANYMWCEALLRNAPAIRLAVELVKKLTGLNHIYVNLVGQDLEVGPPFDVGMQQVRDAYVMAPVENRLLKYAPNARIIVHSLLELHELTTTNHRKIPEEVIDGVYRQGMHLTPSDTLVIPLSPGLILGQDVSFRAR